MNNFDFNTFTMDDDECVTVENVANFELFLLATTAVSFSAKTVDDAAAAKKGEAPQFTSYTRWALTKINELATSQNIDETAPEMKAIAYKLFAAIDTAKGKLNQDPSRLKIGDFDKEFWWFYSEAVCAMVDNVKILKDKHAKLKGGGEDDYDHNTRIQFKHGENTWTYNVRIKDSKSGVSIAGFMNGKPFNFNEAQEGAVTVNQEIITVDHVLRNVAGSMAMESGFKYLCALASKDPVAVSKARTIAIILGGRYQNYLLLTKHFASSLKSVLAETTMNEDKACRHIVDRQFRASESQLTQIVSVLNPQNSWR